MNACNKFELFINHIFCVLFVNIKIGNLNGGFRVQLKFFILNFNDLKFFILNFNDDIKFVNEME